MATTFFKIDPAGTYLADLVGGSNGAGKDAAPVASRVLLSAFSADALHHAQGLSEWARSGWSGRMSVPEFLRHILLVTGLDLNVLNGPLWSLATEMQVSLVLPLIFLLLQSDRSPGTAIALFVSLIGLAFGIGATGSGLLFLPIFMMGTLLAVYRNSVIGLLSRYSKYRVIILIAAMLMFWNRAIQSRYLFPNMTGDYLSSIGSVMIIGVVISFPSQFRWLGQHVIAWLGFVSYSLYLVHLPIILACAAWSVRLHVPLLLGLAVGLGIAFGVSHLLAVFVEKWGVAAGKKVCERLAVSSSDRRRTSSGSEPKEASTASLC
jgi:peptidoglycan/LPS O-acetylase OafA/YrhL